MLIRSETHAWSQVPDQVGCFAKDLVTSAQTGALSAHHLRVEPGAEFKAHAHDGKTELQHITSGRGQMLVGGTWEDVATGDAVLAEPGVLHAIRNNGSDPLFLLCVFTPPLL